MSYKINKIITGQLVNLFQLLDTFNESIFELFSTKLTDNHTIYHESIDCYLHGKQPAIKRKIIYYLKLLVCLFITIKYGVLSLSDDVLLNVELGDFIFIYSTKYKTWQTLIFQFFSLVSGLKLVYYYYEVKSQLYLINMMRSINGRSSLSVFKLNKTHQDKLVLFINVVYWFIFRIILDPPIYLNIFLYFIVSMHAYLSTDYQFSMITFLFTIFLAKIFLDQMNVTITGGLVILFVCIKL